MPDTGYVHTQPRWPVNSNPLTILAPNTFILIPEQSSNCSYRLQRPLPIYLPHCCHNIKLIKLLPKYPNSLKWYIRCFKIGLLLTGPNYLLQFSYRKPALQLLSDYLQLPIYNTLGHASVALHMLLKEKSLHHPPFFLNKTTPHFSRLTSFNNY